MRIGLWVCIIIWILHLIAGAGSGFAVYRLWPERKIRFIWYTMIHLTAAVIDSLMAIVLLFLAKGVVLTWKFTVVMFAFALARDVVRLPLMLYVLRGPGAEYESQLKSELKADVKEPG